jgi:hypothetical protein
MHWFDCPRQLGTNSPDTPTSNAVLSCIPIREEDIVLAFTDGVSDNLWTHEIVSNVLSSLSSFPYPTSKDTEEQTYADGMRFVAQRLVNAAREIAQDPFAESPYMERAIDEGLSIEGGSLFRPNRRRRRLLMWTGGKPDDISVVAALCKRRKR